MRELESDFLNTMSIWQNKNGHPVLSKTSEINFLFELTIKLWKVKALEISALELPWVPEPQNLNERKLVIEEKRGGGRKEEEKILRNVFSYSILSNRLRPSYSKI